MFSPTSPVTGGAQTGLISPTYTIAADVVPSGKRGKSYVVTALGGTQTGVESNVIGNPFQSSFFSPPSPVGTPTLSATTGQPVRVPHNVSQLVTRKGLEVAAGYRYPGNITTNFNIPGGAEIKDPESVRAMLSLHIGLLNQLSASLGDSLIDGTV